MGFWKRLFPKQVDLDIRPIYLTKTQRTLLAAVCYKQAIKEKNRREFNSPLPQFYFALHKKLMDGI